MTQEVYVERVTMGAAPAWSRRVSWGAIFAGLFVTIVIQLTLTLLGSTIGLGSMESLQDANAKTVAIGSGIWLLVTGLISIWVGACVAGRLAGGPLRADGLIHGIVTWSVSICAMLLLFATTAGALLGGTGALLGGAMKLSGASSGEQKIQVTVAEQIRSMFSPNRCAAPAYWSY